ncbi:MAG: hypothetical protein JOZ52_02400 [Acidobacteria bacterium]|nr:hypothetical protein [Acidobacteriota bacterium]
MLNQARTSFAAFVLLASLSYINAQTSAPAKSATPAKAPAAAEKNKAAAAASEEAKRLEEQRRAAAIALLLSVADEARSYRNQALRARIQARAADILWETDAERSRTLFRRAWDAADIADAESQRRLDEERRAREQEGKSFTGNVPPSLRTEVLRMAARRDRALGEEMLRKLDEARKQEAAEASTERSKPSDDADPFELPESLKLRLRLAQQLLETDIERAMEFAEPALSRVSVEGLTFLSYLRAKNAAAADERYAQMLMRAGADPSSDANTVSLLSSYLFTPFLFVRFDSYGSTYSSSYNQVQPPPAVTPELRMSFFRVAEQIFLRPLAPPEQDRTSSGRTGKYMVMARLLPQFEQSAPEQTTTLIKAQMTALAREVPDEYKSADAYRFMPRANDSEESKNDTIQSLLDKAERAQTQEQRDNLYTEAALLAADKGDARTFDFADKIEDTETRKNVRAYVEFMVLRYDIEKKRTEDALKLVHNASLLSMQRVWALTELARAFFKSDREQALQLLEEAATEARRIGGSSAERPRALVGIAAALYEIDRARAWDTMAEVVRAANNTTEEFTGEDARVRSSLQTSTQTSVHTFTVEEFDLNGIFRTLARENLERATALAKDFNGESPRATAIIAIVRATLEKKQATGVKK